MTNPPHALCIGITGKVKLKATPDADNHQTYIYARARAGNASFTGADGQGYQLRRSYHRMDNPSTAQLQGRARMAEATRQWQALSEPERLVYRQRATLLRLTGFNLWTREFCQAHPLTEF